MSQPTRTPSRASIITLAAMGVLIIVAAFWIGYPPEEQYTARHSVGFTLGMILGLDVLLQAFSRGRARILARRAAIAPQGIEHDDEEDSDAVR